MEDTQVGGALAGGLIATALMDTLVAKGVLSAGDARNVLLKARRTVGTCSLNEEQQGAASILDFFLNRYPTHNASL
jgi:hypothetical protein